ncbi:YfgM family protein [Alteromonas sp. CYL-A6]|uniref:YfgM family protein n=1 Tax=Alteromonas nitratireducens TaxID=3390813 RepID=UPI0034BAFF52
MEQFATEEQQVEAIKKFWKEHGMAIVVGALLGLGGLYGWRYYSDAQLAEREAASVNYQTAVESLENANDDQALNAFIEANPDTGYTSIASLVAAKVAADKGDFDTAANHLNRVMTNAADSNLKTMAGVRLARVQMEMNQLDGALSTLDSLSNPAFEAQIAEVKGDVYVRQEKFDEARQAYTLALEKNANNPLLRMKLDNLAVAAGA